MLSLPPLVLLPCLHTYTCDMCIHACTCVYVQYIASILFVSLCVDWNKFAIMWVLLWCCVRQQLLQLSHEWQFMIQKRFFQLSTTLLGLYFHSDRRWVKSIIFEISWYNNVNSLECFCTYQSIIGAHCMSVCLWSSYVAYIDYLQLTWLNVQLEKIWPYVNEVIFFLYQLLSFVLFTLRKWMIE